MTLVLTYLAQRFVIQVSDRRVGVVDTKGAYTLKEDDESKALIIGRSLIFAYTGVARIEGEESVLWLTQVIKPYADENRLHNGTFEVARRASAHFAKLRLPADLKRHTFMGARWMRNRRDKSVFPVAVRITNAYNDAFQPLTNARDDFVVQRKRLRRLSGVSLIPDGAPVDGAAIVHCCRTLRRPYFLNSPLNSARFLAKEVRKIARAYPKTFSGHDPYKCLCYDSRTTSWIGSATEFRTRRAARSAAGRLPTNARSSQASSGSSITVRSGRTS